MEKSEQGTYLSQSVTFEKDLVSFLRGWMIVNFKRSLFVVDCTVLWFDSQKGHSAGFLYEFKRENQQKPTRIIHLGGGKVYESGEEFEDPDTKERFKAFEVTIDHVTYQIVPENEKNYEVLLEVFLKMVELPTPSTRKRTIIAKGAVEVVKTPWRIVRMVTYSLEKVSEATRATPNVLTEFKRDKKGKKKKSQPGNATWRIWSINFKINYYYFTKMAFENAPNKL